MLSDNNITLYNYEEYFILYMDNELTASQKAMVDVFVLQHPQLAEELEALLSTKLPLHDLRFIGKEELLSPAMKANTIDESLLLYIDDELPSAEKAVVAGRIESDADYAGQYALLLQTKLNAADVVSHPAKKELYRHERRTVPFGIWLRIAAAVVLLLISTWFFILNKKKVDDSLAGKPQPSITKPIEIKKPSVVEQVVPKEALPKEATVLSGQSTITPLKKTIKTTTLQDQNTQQDAVAASTENRTINKRVEIMRFDADHFASNKKIGDIVAVNKIIASPSVTSKEDSSYNRQNNPLNNPEVDWAVQTEKKTPARGFFRKVSRFLERKTGIGTVNADNELLVGAVALKLK